MIKILFIFDLSFHNYYFVAMYSIRENCLLIADPFLKEAPFSRAVVFLCEHNEKGSFGLVLNKKFNFALHELVDSVTNLSIEVFIGGPVGTNTLHFLHQYPEFIPGGKKMGDGLYWGGDFKKLLNFINQHPFHPNKLKFFMGYSGWSEGQLENELHQKSWFIAPPKPQIIFSSIDETVWRQSIDLLDDHYKALKNYPLDPQLN